MNETVLNKSHKYLCFKPLCGKCDPNEIYMEDTIWRERGLHLPLECDIALGISDAPLSDGWHRRKELLVAGQISIIEIPFYDRIYSYSLYHAALRNAKTTNDLSLACSVFALWHVFGKIEVAQKVSKKLALAME